jgi:hypothetical protein
LGRPGSRFEAPTDELLRRGCSGARCAEKVRAPEGMVTSEHINGAGPLPILALGGATRNREMEIPCGASMTWDALVDVHRVYLFGGGNRA